MKINKLKKSVPLVLSGLLASFATGIVHANNASFDYFTYQGVSDINAQPGEYINPIIPGYYPDPAITRVGDDYYLVNSSFGYFPGLPVFHSTDLVTWEQVGNAFDRFEQFDFKNVTSSRGMFAPDITYHDGLFYLVTTCVECGGDFFNNFVITAKSPSGPWSMPVPLHIGGIDPALYWDDDGKAYLVHNDEPEGGAKYDGHKGIWLQEFDYHNLKLVGERTQIVNGGTDLSKEPFWVEGPHIFKKDGFYYLIAAQGGTESNHSEVVFRSKTIDGEYTAYKNNPIITQRDLELGDADSVANTGHADFFQTQDGEWWSVFLGVRPYDKAGNFNIGRETFLLPVTWKDNWPTILEPGKKVPLVHSRPSISDAGKPSSATFSYTEDFNNDKLGLNWVSLRNAPNPHYQLDNGQLVLEPRGKFGNKNSFPSYIGVRQQHNIASVKTSLHYDSENNGDQAGIIAVQSDESYLFYGVTQQNNQKELVVIVRDKSEKEKVVKSIPLKSNHVDLAVDINNGQMSFNYTLEGNSATLLSNLDSTFLSTLQAGGFVGVTIGLYNYNAE